MAESQSMTTAEVVAKTLITEHFAGKPRWPV
jgi:hypothetical protein